MVSLRQSAFFIPSNLVKYTRSLSFGHTLCFHYYGIAQSWSASCRIAIDAEFATYCVCNSSSSKPDFTDDATIPRTNNSLWNAVHIWRAIHADGSSSRSECIHSFTNAHCCRITFGWDLCNKNSARAFFSNHYLFHDHRQCLWIDPVLRRH